MIPKPSRRSRRPLLSGASLWARAATAVAVVTALGLGALAATGSSAGAVSANSKTFVYDTYTTVVTTWDPSTEYSNEVIAFQDMYETLTRYSTKTKKLMPLLATSWSSATAGKVWTFHLRHGVLFHTGRPMTAASVKASIERTIKLNGGAAYIWAPVA
ncbi:MAG TPA: ABC transporter substrate-binding protein, partial [Acidimicrobiales bacterium]|nr:ABC transporter substrate-binding protein [Acidimicrobiales bacterium]